jgi:transcriptional regulator with XRE-family HTH domain
MAQGTFGKRLAAARKKAGMSGSKLAEKFGKTKQTVSHWEQDRFQPSLEELVVLCAELRVSADYLVLGADVVRIDSLVGQVARLATLVETRLKSAEMALLYEVLSSDPAIFVANLNKARKPPVIPGSPERALEDALERDILNPRRASDGGSTGAPNTSAAGSPTGKERRNPNK